MTAPADEPDFRDPAFIEDPYPAYAALRARAPVHLGRDGIWLVTGHAEVAALNKDLRLGRDLRRWVAYAGVRPYLADSPLERCVEQWMFSLDPPEHTRLRKLVAKVFTPGNILPLEAKVQAVSDELFAALDARREFDFVRDLAIPYPIRVIADIIGLDASDYEQLKTWSEAVSRVVEPAVRRREKEAANLAVQELQAFLREQVRERRRARRDDILSLLIAAEEDGDRLTEDELISNVVLMFMAGFETTTHLLGNALVAFTRHPEALAPLRTEPSLGAPSPPLAASTRSLVPRAVEEVLRFDGPANVNARVAHEPIAIAGIVIEPGQLVFNLLGAANRDPAVFADPDRLDLTRDPNPHLTFGGGVHYCLGAVLARLEARIAFEHLLARLDRWEVDLGGLQRRMVVNLRGYASVPVRARG